MQEARTRATIQALGTDIGPEALKAVGDLFDIDQRNLLKEYPATARDVAYGTNERHRLDVYCPADRPSSVPIIIWLHGGGFMRGDKGDNDNWQNANAGAAAARQGYLGIVMNYRLAPQNLWPSGAEDIANVIRWARQNAGTYGGDPNQIVLVGTSAGAAHVAGYIHQYPNTADIRGAVLLSVLYGITPLTDVRDFSYFGEDSSAHSAMLPLEAIVETEIPLLVACSEFDPPRFQEEFTGLLQRRLSRHGRLPRAYIASGHNHYSLAYHLGTEDSRVADEIWSFVNDCIESDASDAE
jgi:triacylglycerol lipase